MLARAGVKAVDTAPEQLRVSADAGRLPAVAVHRVLAPPYRLELRILAASHQVVVEPADRGDDRGGDITVGHVETVACRLVPSAAPLAHGAVYEHGGWRLAASVVRVDAAGFAGEAEAWLARGRDDGRCVVVRFPNHPHALTALAVHDGAGGGTASRGGGRGVGWTGVHLYPSPDGPGGIVVRTTTRPIRPRTTPAAAVAATTATAAGSAAAAPTAGTPARAAAHIRGMTEVHG
jgi:hypothetical protein